MQNFSFFEVPEKEAINVVKALSRAKWNGRKVVVEVSSEEGGKGHENGSSERKGGKRFGKGEDRTPRYDNKDRKTKDASTKGPKSGKKENNHKGWNKNRTPFPKTLRFHLRHPLFTPDCPLHQVSGNVAKSNRQRQKKHLSVYHGSIAIKHMVYNQITKSRN